MTTCRDEILSVVKSFGGSTNEFTVAQVVDEMRRRGSQYAGSTIRTHVTSFMCINAPVNHAITYPDIERLERGIYRLVADVTVNKQDVTQEVPLLNPTEEVLEEVPAGNSQVQRDAEGVALEALANQLNLEFKPERIYLPDGSRVEVDGVSHLPRVLVEVWAHQGKPKPAQRNKVLSDPLKLRYVAEVLDGDYRKILCLTDAEAAAPFLGATWYAGALRHMSVDVEVVELPAKLQAAIREAQARQSGSS